jgi:hypothetical protein
MKFTLLLFCVLFGIGFTFGQNKFANHWHLTEGVHVDFSLGGPFVDDNTEMETFQTTLSYSNEAGELLFYSNGGGISGFDMFVGRVWNRNNEVMPNGVLCDTCGCQSVANGGVVIPDFVNPDIYHIYMPDCIETITHTPEAHVGLRRTTIDMSLDGGLGDVVEQGVPIYGGPDNFMGETIAATQHQNGIDYWIVTHDHYYPESDTFYVFLVTEAGVAAPIIQRIGSSSDLGMEISPDGKKLAFGSGIYDFNNGTGMLSNFIELGDGEGAHFGLGKCFSSNSQMFYTSDCLSLFQYDLNAADIVGSKTVIFNNGDSTTCHMKSMQLGPNCKIYITILDQNHFGVINLPNASGLACNYVDTQLSTGVYYFETFNFPSYINSRFDCETATIDEFTDLDWTVSHSIDGNFIEIKVASLATATTYSITDGQGRVVLHNALALGLKTSVDISSLARGVYYISVENGGNAKKIIRQ